jgi:hypothetical protein
MFYFEFLKPSNRLAWEGMVGYLLLILGILLVALRQAIGGRNQEHGKPITYWDSTGVSGDWP